MRNYIILYLHHLNSSNNLTEDTLSKYFFPHVLIRLSTKILNSDDQNNMKNLRKMYNHSGDFSLSLLNRIGKYPM